VVEQPVPIYLTTVSRRMSAFVSTDTVPAETTPKIDCLNLNELCPLGNFILAPGGSTLTIAARLSQLSPSLQQLQGPMVTSETPNCREKFPETKHFSPWDYLKMLWSFMKSVVQAFLRLLGSVKAKKDFRFDDHIEKDLDAPVPSLSSEPSTSESSSLPEVSPGATLHRDVSEFKAFDPISGQD